MSTVVQAKPREKPSVAPLPQGGSCVLVIFGAGHLGWLRHDFASDPTFRLRELAEPMRKNEYGRYLRRVAAEGRGRP